MNWLLCGKSQGVNNLCYASTVSSVLHMHWSLNWMVGVWALARVIVSCSLDKTLLNWVTLTAPSLSRCIYNCVLADTMLGLILHQVSNRGGGGGRVKTLQILSWYSMYRNQKKSTGLMGCPGLRLECRLPCNLTLCYIKKLWAIKVFSVKDYDYSGG